jgi:hypothetical protein
MVSMQCLNKSIWQMAYGRNEKRISCGATGGTGERGILNDERGTMSAERGLGEGSGMGERGNAER